MAVAVNVVVVVVLTTRTRSEHFRFAVGGVRVSSLKEQFIAKVFFFLRPPLTDINIIAGVGVVIRTQWGGGACTDRDRIRTLLSVSAADHVSGYMLCVHYVRMHMLNTGHTHARMVGLSNRENFAFGSCVSFRQGGGRCKTLLSSVRFYCV